MKFDSDPISPMVYKKAGCLVDSPLRAFADELAMNLTYSRTVTALVSM